MSMTHIHVPAADYTIPALEAAATPAREYQQGQPAADAPHRLDKSTGLPIWEVEAAITHDGELVHNGRVKILATAQPQVRAMTAIRAESVRITPWVDDRAKRARVQLSWSVVPVPTIQDGGK